MRRFVFAQGLSTAAIVAVACALIAGCSNTQNGENGGSPQAGSTPAGTVIKIGADLPLSGGDASDGVPTANGVKLAIMDANKEHLIPGFTFQADILDDAVNGVHSPKPGREEHPVVRRGQRRCSALSGRSTATSPKSKIPLTNSLGIALISPSNTNPDLTKGVLARSCASPTRNPSPTSGCARPTISKARSAPTMPAKIVGCARHTARRQ